MPNYSKMYNNLFDTVTMTIEEQEHILELHKESLRKLKLMQNHVYQMYLDAEDTPVNIVKKTSESNESNLQGGK